ncbi:MAG TPA: DUF502 domain-containing protein [Saprospiraceae bacterium]|nr:DUF502 domain-containing protein [Saprospiraceae bacterium]MCB9271277.1 DUF502 domain-containing protein [Lewinellaceae bacterium]HPG07795.1 DUF502 domain-containing protein [Saprospiraceae bacterium]HPQ99282.1 DUF502 domain-containing protein [Saprospiraceae bacterium]HQU54405.1 DUF502 domain-containing protein [Saprospiraceae bacterium]
MKKLVNYFLQGLVFIAPLAITGYIIYLVFDVTDQFSRDLISRFFDVHIPGAGVLTMILFLVLIGFLGQTIVARPLINLVQNFIARTPVLRDIYSALKDFIMAFVGKDRKFNIPVLVLVNPVTQLEKLGFLTEQDLGMLELKDKVAVYFPHSYNFSGELFIVPRTQIKVLDLPASEVMKFVVSGGVSGLNKHE